MKERTYLIEWSHPGKYICHFKYTFTFFVIQPQSKSAGNLTTQEGQKLIIFVKSFLSLKAVLFSNTQSKPKQNSND